MTLDEPGFGGSELAALACIVLVLDAVSSSASASTANAEYEYEKLRKTSIETPKHSNNATSKLAPQAQANGNRFLSAVSNFGTEWFDSDSRLRGLH
jgi:hypothetical protein